MEGREHHQILEFPSLGPTPTTVSVPERREAGTFTGSGETDVGNYWYYVRWRSKLFSVGIRGRAPIELKGSQTTIGCYKRDRRHCPA